MAARLQVIHDELTSALQALPGVFSTPQWGGRAWKLPGPGGNRRKPKLVAHLVPSEDAIGVSFKLERKRARDVVERHEWIEPHSFRTLAPSGWVSARVRTKRQAAVLVELLAESRALHPGAQETPAPRRGSASDPVTRHLDQVMDQARARGWTPG
jgi:hypothetical protein